MMNENDKAALLHIAASSERELPLRIRALQDLGASGDPALVVELKKLLDRSRPGPAPLAFNYDPEATERVVDLHVIEALHRLGDDAEAQRIVPLVARAGGVLQGLDDELRNAAAVIAAIGRVDVIGGLVGLAATADPAAARNAGVVLDRLALPDPPVRQPVSALASLSRAVSFTIHRFKEELETLEALSRGAISLSPGTMQFIVAHDYDRGMVRREGRTLASIVTDDLRVLDLEYFVVDQQVVVCTYSEAGERWQAWWHDHGKDLVPVTTPPSFALRK
jgi:hypothetical protein